MTALEQLKSILQKEYVSEDGDPYKIKFKPGLTEAEIDKRAAMFPTGQVPASIRELLTFTRGFEFYGLDEVTFDGISEFGFESIFPDSVQLAGDGAGNFWILDVDHRGNWGSVYFVCHDPAVVVRHSADLTEFIIHIDEYGREASASHLSSIQEKRVMEIWSREHGFTDLTLARTSEDGTLREFASRLPDHFVIADLRDQPNGAGFAWGKFGAAAIDNAVRHETELLWGIESPGKKGVSSNETPGKKGFFSKLFGR